MSRGLAKALLVLALVCSGPNLAHAESTHEGATLSVCYNYGCYTQAEVTFSAAQLAAIGTSLRAADAVGERERLAVAIGQLYAWAGAQSPIFADKGGNLADEAVYGRMDCIDHSLTTTGFLRLLEAKGMLRYHRVGERVLRSRFLFFEHYAAQVIEHDAALRAQVGEAVSDTPAMDSRPEAARFAVDSWFFDNGQSAVVLPLANWMAGEGPDVGW